VESDVGAKKVEGLREKSSDSGVGVGGIACSEAGEEARVLEVDVVTGGRGRRGKEGMDEGGKKGGEGEVLRAEGGEGGKEDTNCLPFVFIVTLSEDGSSVLPVVEAKVQGEGVIGRGGAGDADVGREKGGGCGGRRGGRG